jgi:hypothetical protein
MIDGALNSKTDLNIVGSDLDIKSRSVDAET